MDPLLLAPFNRAVVFFMTRSDVFTAFTRPIFWMAHMLPIYRQRDGVNTKEKNQEVFKKSSEILLRKRSLLIFGEGVTDDVFIRRLKPLKKGAVRIGFTALESCNWAQDVYLATIGCNYSNPAKFRSDVVIRNSEKILLNEFRTEFETNPNKIIQELTVRLEAMLKNDLIHVKEEESAVFTERMMLIQRKGMPMFEENTVPLLERWNYAKDLVEDFNNNPEKYAALRAPVKDYFEGLKARNIDDQKLYDATHNKISIGAIFMQILLLPIALFGAIHCGLFYFGIKRYVESKFRRPVFWGSTKLIMMMLILGILNLSLLFLLPPYIGMLGAIAYFLFIPFAGLIFHNGISFLKRMASHRNIRAMNVGDILKERLTLSNKIKEITND
ncbi:MAG: 1-acyl-sn-glycerol-3-phosphate acyltransferase [Crocinitomicaceae bacterium]|nr:1-acyl-sn-glycerol-3-phosphate acyltransferase [Crocinitomicaceae bacterium]